MINSDKSVASINEEKVIINMQDLDNVIKMFPEEANYGDFSSSENSPKIQNADQLVMYFDGKTHKSGNQFLIKEK